MEIWYNDEHNLIGCLEQGCFSNDLVKAINKVLSEL